MQRDSDLSDLNLFFSRLGCQRQGYTNLHTHSHENWAGSPGGIQKDISGRDKNGKEETTWSGVEIVSREERHHNERVDRTGWGCWGLNHSPLSYRWNSKTRCSIPLRGRIFFLVFVKRLEESLNNGTHKKAVARR